MTAAETLREAAALMRKRAEAATPGPWVAWGHHVCCVVNQCNCGCGGMAGLPHEPLCGLEDLGEVADPEHIASWHPLVALAVADWLETYADLYEASRHRDRPVFGDHEQALAVARAYLGGAS